MENLFLYLSIGYLLTIVAAKTERHYTFGDDCSVSLEHVDEDTVIYAKYDGSIDKGLNSWCNYMSFIGRDDGYMNEYEICVTPVTYEDPDCSMELQYSSDYSGYDDVQKYTCSNIPTTKYCGKQDEYFYIRLKQIGGLRTQNERVKLKIEAVMTYNYGQTVGIIVGSVFGGICLVSVALGVIVHFACKGKRSTGQVMSTSGTRLPWANVFNGYNSSGTYPAGYSQPQTNYSTNYSTPLGNNQTTAQQPSGLTYNNSPPSYADAVNI